MTIFSSDEVLSTQVRAFRIFLLHALQEYDTRENFHMTVNTPRKKYQRAKTNPDGFKQFLLFCSQIVLHIK